MALNWCNVFAVRVVSCISCIGNYQINPSLSTFWTMCIVVHIVVGVHCGFFNYFVTKFHILKQSATLKVTNQPKLYSSIQISPTWSIFSVLKISCVQCINAQIKPKQSIFRSSFRKMCIVVHWHIQHIAVGMCCEYLEKPVWKCNSAWRNSVVKKCYSYSLANQTKMHSSIQIGPNIAV